MSVHTRLPSAVSSPRRPAAGLSLRKVWRFALYLALAALLFCFGACSQHLKVGPGEPQNLLAGRSGNYTATANIAYRELSATATISQESPRSCTVAFTAPASLRDMSFVFREDVVDLSYKGIGFTFDPNSVPGGAVAKMAVSAINMAMKDDGVTVEYDGTSLSLNGVMESGSFTLRLDPESGNLMKLLVPAEELEIEFVNFSFLD